MQAYLTALDDYQKAAYDYAQKMAKGERPAIVWAARQKCLAALDAYLDHAKRRAA